MEMTGAFSASKRSWNTQVPFYKVLIVGGRGGTTNPRQKFSISETKGVLAWLLSAAFVSRSDSHTYSNEPFFIFGSFTWLYYNRSNILENQTLLLARVCFIRAPQAAFWSGFSKNLGAACFVAQWKLWLIQLESPSFPSVQSDCRRQRLQHGAVPLKRYNSRFGFL